MSQSPGGSYSGYSSAATGAGAMFFSAVLFGFFGFYFLKAGQGVLLFDLVVWTLRVAAIGFAVCGLLAVMRSALATPLHLLVSLAAVIMFAVLGVWHFLRPNTATTNGFLLLFFAAFNGWSVWEEIRFLRARRAAAGRFPGDEAGRPR